MDIVIGVILLVCHVQVLQSSSASPALLDFTCTGHNVTRTYALAQPTL